MTSWLFSFEKATNNSSCVKIIKNITQSNNQFGTGSVCLFIFRFGIWFSTGISSVQIYKLAVILLSKEVKFSLLLEFLCIFTLITIALSISFTIKCRLFARKERLAKRNKATLISLWSLGRATSADIGREFCPLHLVWWALFFAWTQPLQE